MSEYVNAEALVPGCKVVCPSTGAVCDLFSIEVQGSTVWLLWGSVRPPGSLGYKAKAGQPIAVLEGEADEIEVEW